MAASVRTFQKAVKSSRMSSVPALGRSTNQASTSGAAKVPVMQARNQSSVTAQHQSSRPTDFVIPTAGRSPANAESRSEVENLRDIINQMPFVYGESPKSEGVYDFRFPYASVFTAPTREIGLSLSGLYARALKEHGIAVISLGFDDPESQFILDVVEAMNCKPDTHSSTQGALWDVTFKPEGVQSEATGKSAHSISHSLGEFTWHSDGAFEANPTQFFGFHIIHPDNEGGGVFRILSADELAQNLSPKTVQTLTTHEYTFRVPDEFYKGQPTVSGQIMRINPITGRAHVRYRKDIMHDPPSEDPDACAAIEELNGYLGTPEDVGESVPRFAFKENAVLLMDNTRYLHSRTNIKDPKRWLRRVRFHGTPQT